MRFKKNQTRKTFSLLIAGLSFFLILLSNISISHEASLGSLDKMKKVAQCDSLEKFPKLYINSNDPFDSPSAKPRTIIFNVFNKDYSDAVFWCHWKDKQKRSLLYWNKHFENSACPSFIKNEQIILGEIIPTEKGFILASSSLKQRWQCSNGQWQPSSINP